MRFVFVSLLLGLCAFCLAGPTQDYKVADKQFLEKQKNILRLFKYVNQPSYYKDHVEIAKSFSIEENYESYTKPEVAKHFIKHFNHRFLPRGEIFSVFYNDHLKEAEDLFKLFFYAKDFETFYKTAVWARQHLNEGLFLYAISVAIVHRADTFGIIIPPIYEVYPYYFFSSDAIYQAQKYKQFYGGKVAESSGSNGYTVNSNYSGHYLNLNPEQSLSYYLEDVGINSFFYYYDLYYPFWLSGEDFDLKNDKRGELFYYTYQQLLARYYLERLSNGFGEIEFFNWDLPFKNGYYPSLTYPNGLEFPTRPNFANLHEYFYNYGQKWTLQKYGYSYTYVNEYERRLRDAIDFGYILTKDGQKVDLYSEDGFNTFGNLVEGNAESLNRRYYGQYQIAARHLLGYSFQPLDIYKVAPSALEHFETSLRDPAFYQFAKKVVTLFQKYKFHQHPSYYEKELYFPGVKVEKVEFDRLITYFDYFYSDLSNAVYVSPEEYEHDSFNVRVRQHRLNHKPFTYKIYVNSDKDQESIVYIYLGPKYDQYGRYINLTENRLNFVEFDHFKYSLKSGQNIIQRNPYQNIFYGRDRTSFKELYQKVLGAYNGNGELHLDGKETFANFPLRYLLPKGTYDGFEYQFYVIVSPYVPYKGKQKVDENKFYYPRVGSGNQYIDGYPLGYPFDRFIEYEDIFYNLPNSYFYTTKIYHRDADDINASHATQN